MNTVFLILIIFHHKSFIKEYGFIKICIFTLCKKAFLKSKIKRLTKRHNSQTLNSKREKMKVCNLGTVTHLEDIMQMSDYICTEAPLLIIVPAFDRIKRSLQRKFPFICSVPNRKRLHKPSCIWKKHCMETVSGFLPRSWFCL